MFNIEKFKNYSFYFLIGIISLVGIFLRVRLFIEGTAFEDDECRLVLTMLGKSYWQMFLPLGDAQSAPPIFLCLSKFLADFFGYEEKILWIISQLASFGSMFYFYKLVTLYFKKKISVIISFFFFALNFSIILYANTFKQYSLDIFVGILCIYYLHKTDIKNLSAKQMMFLTLFTILLPFVSLPSLFFIGAFYAINIFKNLKDPKCLLKIVYMIIPLLICMGLYYVFNLAPSKADLDYYFPDYWVDGFLSFSVKSSLETFISNIKYYSLPNKLSLFLFILYVWGIVNCFFDRTDKLSIYLLVVSAFVFLASLLHLYPWYARVGLFYASIFMLFVVKSLDDSKFNKPAFYVALMLLILSLYKYDLFYIANLNNNNTVTYSPKKLMLILKEKFNPETDAVLCNSASSASYLFYSGKYNFYTENVYETDIREADREKVFNYLNSLKKGQRFWFYLIKDYRKSGIFPYIQEWINTKEVLYYTRDKNSSLLYIQN